MAKQIIMNCEVCRNSFSTNRSNARFCGWNCYQTSHKSKQVIKVCPICHKQFEPNRQSTAAKMKITFCSYSCASKHKRAEPNYSERFWSKVDKSGDCWIWKSSIRSKHRGYGVFVIKYKRHSAHRIAYLLANNVTTTNGLFVCHKCNNPSCVRPEHLYLGTHNDNMRDRKESGHYKVSNENKRKLSQRTKGVNNLRALFDTTDIQNIWKLYKSGKTKTEICRIYNVSDSVICNIINGKTYTNVPH